MYIELFPVRSGDGMTRVPPRCAALPPGVGCSSKLSSSLQRGFTLLLVESGRGLQRQAIGTGRRGHVVVVVVVAVTPLEHSVRGAEGGEEGPESHHVASQCCPPR